MHLALKCLVFKTYELPFLNTKTSFYFILLLFISASFG
ncbi:hypothetical protein DR73_2901 [Enterobacteriaceae bacterium ATCC 29904]|nr:hypothetical protein DR73_2901 [Enterobacteriaceae bacterium ATCC 29904]